MSGKIKALPPEVYRRIKAGEVIHHPKSCVKELMENSLDAGCRNIVITLKRGGIDLIRVRDDGHGISEEDLPVSAQPHTTSKLEKIEDLKSMSTYGFRGEALSSMTFVGRVTIRSKTADSLVCHEIKFVDGKPLMDSRRSFAGTVGTTIEVAELFYREKSRRDDLKSSTELKRILDCVVPYALHNSGVSIILNKNQGSQFKTVIRTHENASFIDNISNLYTPEISREVLHLVIDLTKQPPSRDALNFKCSMYFTHPNFATKDRKNAFLLFINNRYVFHKKLKKSILSCFESYIPTGSKPFVYISLELPTDIVDINRSVSKSEVGFLSEEYVISRIQKGVKSKLENCNASRTFKTKTQTLLVDSQSIRAPPPPIVNNSQRKSRSLNQNIDIRRDYEKVRIDDQRGDIERYLVSKKRRRSEDYEDSELPIPKRAKTGDMNQPDSGNQSFLEGYMDVGGKSRVKRDEDEDDDEEEDENKVEYEKESNLEQLTSVEKLLKEVVASSCQAISTIFASPRDVQFVGYVNPRLSLIQFDKKLFIIDISKVSEELVYQYFLKLIRYKPSEKKPSNNRPSNKKPKLNFRKIKFQEPLNVKEYVKLALRHRIEEKLVSSEVFREKHKKIFHNDGLLGFLKFHCQIEFIKKNNTLFLVSIPQIFKNHFPPFHRLPNFLFDIITGIDLVMKEEEEVEVSAIRSIGRILGKLYKSIEEFEEVKEEKLAGKEKIEEEEEEEVIIDDSTQGKKKNLMDSLEWMAQHVYFAGCREIRLKCPLSWGSDGTIVEVANIKRLNQIFERC